MTAAPVMLEGAPNFRDLGGLPVTDGRVRGGLVFRSEGPVRLTAEDVAKLHRIDFRLVCDLRSATEREAEPNLWCAAGPMELLNLDVSTDLRALSAEGWQAMAQDPGPAGARAAMLATYRAKPRAMAPKLRLMFDRVLDGDALPLLIHCTAGKDRTGFAAAMLLAALGAPPDVLRSDYLKSAAFIDARFHPTVIASYAQAFGAAPDDQTLKAMTGLEIAYLDAALDAAAAQWGSLEAYLSVGLGLSMERRARLRRRLVEPAS